MPATFSEQRRVNRIYRLFDRIMEKKTFVLSRLSASYSGKDLDRPEWNALAHRYVILDKRSIRFDRALTLALAAFNRHRAAWIDRLDDAIKHCTCVSADLAWKIRAGTTDVTLPRRLAIVRSRLADMIDARAEYMGERSPDTVGPNVDSSWLGNVA